MMEPRDDQVLLDCIDRDLLNECINYSILVDEPYILLYNIDASLKLLYGVILRNNYSIEIEPFLTLESILIITADKDLVNLNANVLHENILLEEAIIHDSRIVLRLKCLYNSCNKCLTQSINLYCQQCPTINTMNLRYYLTGLDMEEVVEKAIKIVG